MHLLLPIAIHPEHSSLLSPFFSNTQQLLPCSFQFSKYLLSPSIFMHPLALLFIINRPPHSSSLYSTFFLCHPDKSSLHSSFHIHPYKYILTSSLISSAGIGNSLTLVSYSYICALTPQTSLPPLFLWILEGY